jgi:serine/threonine protein kinase
MPRNPFFLREIAGESGKTWIVNTSDQAGISRRCTPYYGWRRGADEVPTVWVVKHWIMKNDDESWERSQEADREHLNRSFDLAQREGVLGNPLFLQVLDRASSAEPDDTLFVVSELADTTLEEEMRARRLAPHEVEEVERSVGAALEVIHGLGLVHCDVTPSNIFKVVGQWKLGDLGAAVETGQPIQALPRDRRYVPDGYDFQVPADPELDKGCLSNIVASLSGPRSRKGA